MENKRRLLDLVRDQIRVRHCSIRTEASYTQNVINLGVISVIFLP
ncbi:hypothetical protein MNBD_GAMMA07-1716 [hydrothermal vent metagenome]|uniref:Uncharacterized protein n=1 Tax=hydrothermal vent metagenome TaxID=652676 RepID=A0A3B0WKX4_9ZZZZ